MSLLSIVSPAVMQRATRILSRDQAIFLLVTVNALMLGLETYLAHLISQTIRTNEWIPIVLGPVTGVVLLLAFALRKRYRMVSATLAVVALSTNIVVGMLGTYFHLQRAILPAAPFGQATSLARLVWSPPVIAPLAFVLVGLFGLVAYMEEKPQDSGCLWLSRGVCVRLPLSKTRIYFLLTCLGVLLAAVSSVMDHVRTDFSNGWLWVPTLLGVFGTVVTLLLGLINRPTHSDLITYTLTMVMLLLVGPLGVFLHVMSDLNAQHVVVVEQFIRGAPVLAPLVFSNMALFGLLVLLPSADA